MAARLVRPSLQYLRGDDAYARGRDDQRGPHADQWAERNLRWGIRIDAVHSKSVEYRSLGAQWRGQRPDHSYTADFRVHQSDGGPQHGLPAIFVLAASPHRGA